ncbi:MAG: indole-3-glycerol phosphate synthase TrpC [Candidatus Sumerlaeaceae bacterium]|nr:indole-3-glycerol phosphate synthase TrpC [Candidatus Sumerlaeaceae bacterium]
MILDEIVAYKREFVAECKRRRPLAELKACLQDVSPSADFQKAISRKHVVPQVIAEIKKASPSKGIIREDFRPDEIAESYVSHGAAALSILTDEEFFKGHLEYLCQVRERFPTIPILRKDFTIDEYQIYEARAAGASCVLLIVAILDKYQLIDYRQLAEELGMAALTEVHLEKEADLAAEYGARLLGINNRDLRTFEVDLGTTERIIRILGGPNHEFTFVAESGVSKPEDVTYLAKFGVDAMLIGESFMRAEDPGVALSALLAGALELLRGEEQPGA